MTNQAKPAAFPDGHFYSPVVDVADIESRRDQIWPAEPEVLGIDFNHERQHEIITDWFPRYFDDFDYPQEEQADPNKYFLTNSQYSWLDARSLFVLMRHWRPKKIIEVGSGFSSLMMADVKQRFLNNETHISCVEPYPRPFLKAGVPGIDRLIEEKVEGVPLAVFDELEAGDILFIDSSHVGKTGSDVNYLYFNVLPRLKPGVRIHIHDIFLPDDYLPEWVIDENRSWNEQYLLRALLMHSTAFKVVFGCSYAFRNFPEEVGNAIKRPGAGFGGSAFWIERI